MNVLDEPLKYGQLISFERFYSGQYQKLYEIFFFIHNRKILGRRMCLFAKTAAVDSYFEEFLSILEAIQIIKV